MLLNITYLYTLPSVLWRCWLGGRKGIRPIKNFEWSGAGMVVCLERDADLHMAQLMPLPLSVSCFSKIQIGFTFLVPAHLGSPGQRAVKRVCVWGVCVYVCMHKELFTIANIRHYVPPGDWPPNSPDLCPIENIWSVMARAVYASPEPQTLMALKRRLRKSWD